MVLEADLENVEEKICCPPPSRWNRSRPPNPSLYGLSYRGSQYFLGCSFQDGQGN
jgi:hypothetical protein